MKNATRTMEAVLEKLLHPALLDNLRAFLLGGILFFFFIRQRYRQLPTPLVIAAVAVGALLALIVVKGGDAELGTPLRALAALLLAGLFGGMRLLRQSVSG